MTCLSCAHISLKSSPAHAAVGFGHCKFDGIGVFVSIDHACDRHAPADAEIVAKREAWALTRGKK